MGKCFKVSLQIPGEFRKLVDVNFVCAMGPPGGGRNPTTARLLRHYNFLSFTEMENPSLMNIFGSILKSWTGTCDTLIIRVAFWINGA
ncbi:hypothetical protein DPMN_044914 [Dreissena polymorpha]|uniref:Uncharacterized protein n=1 Tax=Dreissena polymorpha TaxID=45954 RepID=A0A9D4D517_DREPO|nr:hypothetical protein DPMN_044914 [Dreissena polymorpha]